MFTSPTTSTIYLSLDHYQIKKCLTHTESCSVASKYECGVHPWWSRLTTHDRRIHYGYSSTVVQALLYSRNSPQKFTVDVQRRSFINLSQHLTVSWQSTDIMSAQLDYNNLAQSTAPQIDGHSPGGEKYIKWSVDLCYERKQPLTMTRDAPGVEIIQPGEEELKLKTAGHFCALQRLNFQNTHHCMRGTHLKTQGVRHSLRAILQFLTICSVSKAHLRSSPTCQPI